MEYLKNKDIDGLSFMGWKAEIESEQSGCIVWFNKDNNTLIYATPSWDEDGETPFTVVREGDEYGGDIVAIMKANESMSVEKQKQFYLSILQAVMVNL